MTSKLHFLSRLTLATLLATFVATSLQADDRRLITGFEEIPTVFFLFDTSGSMHWSSQCLQEDFDAGECDYLCPTGDCWVPGNGDSPNSKFYQAKEAVYQVIKQTENINVGFATFNQDQLRANRKHWLYEALDDGPDIPGWGPYPRGRVPGTPGSWNVFGDSWSCFTGPNGADNADDIGCDEDTPARLTDQWERDRVSALPIETPDFNSNNDTSRTNFIQDPGGTVWEIRFRVLNSDPHLLGDPTVRTRIRRRRCTNTDCTTTDMSSEKTVDYALISDYLSWDVNTARGPARAGFFSQGTASDGPANNTCDSWDSNLDTGNDIFDGYNTRWPTMADATYTPLMDVGDVLPMDWRGDNKQELLQRLAPNLVLGETIPDFRIARYFEDIVVPTDELKLKDEAVRPILSFGATPIGTSVEDFYDWVEGTGGWLETAQLFDPSFTCRRTYLIILSDGNQSTCDGDDPCLTKGTKELYDQLGLKTYVVAFGVPPHLPFLPPCVGAPDESPDVNCCMGGSPNCFVSTGGGLPPDVWPPGPTNRQNRSLRCMASTGGTGNEDYDLDGVVDSEGPGVIYPQNQSELLDALVAILDEIKPAPASFSTAAVPSVQAEAADKVFLSEFTPIPERSVWQGRVNAFLKPVPVDSEDKPDTSEICPPDDLDDPDDDPSACLLWEAGDVILNNQITIGDPVGDLETQRRLYYSEFGDTVPKTRHFLLPTQDGVTPLAQEFDFWRAFDIDFTAGSTSTYGPARDDANNIVDFVTSVKTTPMNSDFPVPFDYVLNDIFHSDPLLLGSPNNLLYFFDDLNGYRQFAIDHAFRRRVLMFGTNGGLLHGIDAGVCRELNRDDPRVCLFDNGSGRELFGFMPRIAMPTVNQLALGPVPRHRFVVDGRTQAIDVFIDPLHEGALSPVDPPNPIEREWRTVAIGGLREGGNVPPEGVGDFSSPEDSNPSDSVLPVNQPMSGYFAIDVTMPDPLESLSPGATRPPIPQTSGVEPPSCLMTTDGIAPTDPNCGPIVYAAPLWEFTDTIEGVRLDEDDNGHVDLAFAWSNPSTGRMQVCTAGCDTSDPALEDRYVAVLGGGFDSLSPFLRGNHVYIVDIETGETLYKQSVIGAIAAEAAAVDTDFNGYLDTVYVGTSYGRLYRIDIGPFDDDADDNTPPKFPELVLTTVTETANDGTVVMRDEMRIIDPDFAPYLLLSTSDPDIVPYEIRPIFYRPSVIFVPEFNKYAVAVGTGNREDIFRRDQETGRFFTFVDDVSPLEIKSGAFTPYSPVSAELTPLLKTSPRLEEVNLLQPGEGWWLELDTNERIVTEPFALSGILFFSTFVPDPDGPEVIPENSLCREKGVSNVYGVFTTNADGLLADDDDINDPSQLVRYTTVTGLVSAPFTEQSQTKNPAPPGSVDTIDDLSARHKYVRDRLKQLFPDNCTFPPGYRTDVKTRSSGTELNFIAPVPVCVVQKSFREF